MIDQMGRIARPLAEGIKKQYGLKKLTIDYPTVSELVAGKLSKKQQFKFQVHKTSRTEGILKLL